MKHDPFVRKLEDGRHAVVCHDCAEGLGLRRDIGIVVAICPTRRWANVQSDRHRRAK